MEIRGTRPRQVRYQAALRPDICRSIHPMPLRAFFQTRHSRGVRDIGGANRTVSFFVALF